MGVLDAAGSLTSGAESASMLGSAASAIAGMQAATQANTEMAQQQSQSEVADNAASDIKQIAQGAS
jgi:hypothetical protein